MRRNGSVVEGGFFAGLSGGLAVALWMMLMRVLQGANAWPAVKGASFPFLGERAFEPGFDGLAVSLGLVAHFGVSIFWGLLFAVAFDGLSRLGTVFAGLFWGLVVWVGMYYVVLPLAGAGEISRGPIAPAVVSHLIFGLFVALGYLPFQRPAEARREVRP